MAVAFDTLKFVRNLTQAGLPEAQAEIFANAHRDAFKEALDSNLATKADIAELRSEMAEFRESTTAQIAEFKESTTAQIAEFKESTTAQIAELRSEMVEFKEGMRGEFAELKESTTAQIAELRSEMAEFKESIMAEISQLKRRDDHLQAQISHLKWIMIFNLGFTVTIMWKVFS